MPKRNSQMKEVRTQIVRTYAGWTALSALRSGSRVKSRAQIYGLLKVVPFARILEPSDRPIKAAEFASWHHDAVLALCRREPLLGVGWAAKLVNVYLKTCVYVGGLGRPELITAIHPPIDGGLWAGLKTRFHDRPEILEKTHAVDRIRKIEDYPTYTTIISGFRAIAEDIGCLLIEVDQFWEGANSPSA
jgi:hypothetical protein